jgi:hypothetical protein
VGELRTAEEKWVYQAKDGPTNTREGGKFCNDLRVFPATAACDDDDANDVSIRIRSAQYSAHVTAP